MVNRFQQMASVQQWKAQARTSGLNLIFQSLGTYYSRKTNIYKVDSSLPSSKVEHLKVACLLAGGGWVAACR